MAKLRLFAKDRAQQRERRIGTLVITGLGVGVALIAGVYLWRKIVASSSQPGQRRDWSGCGTVPADVSPQPRFECGQWVSDSLHGESGQVLSRTWTAAPGVGGLWVYEITGSSTVAHEEQYLTLSATQGAAA